MSKPKILIAPKPDKSAGQPKLPIVKPKKY